MLRALYKSSHKSRILQSLLLPSLFHVPKPPRHLNLVRPDWTLTRRHSTTCSRGRQQQQLTPAVHVVSPCATNTHLRPPMHPFLNGEGSWNVSWDARPARWLHRPDSAWFLFGICSCLPPVVGISLSDVVSDDHVIQQDKLGSCSDDDDKATLNYKVTGVLADGRCLFRAIAHGACLRAGEEAPDEARQRTLADELRAQVVKELLKRREESEWFIEGDFDAYVKRIMLPTIWGGEPELLMATHVLQTPICVFMMDSKSQNLTNIAKYGEEYQKNGDPINVLFHGYGHYDLVETIKSQSFGH
ncbi:unnamed protein product [Rhodiola kirilowii]